MAKTESSQTKTTEASSEQIAPEPSRLSSAPAPFGMTLILLVAGVTAGYLVTRWFDSGTPPTYLGYVTADSSTISASGDLVVDNILAKKGEIVEKGAELVSYSNFRHAGNVSELDRSISSIDKKIATINAKAELETSWRIKQIDAEIHRENIELSNLFLKEFDIKIERDARADILKKQSPPRQAIQPEQVFKPAQWTTSSADEDRLREVLKYSSLDNALEVIAAQIGLHENRIATLQSLKEQLPEQIISSMGIEELEQEKTTVLADRNRQPNQIESKTEKANIYGVVRKIPCRKGGRYSKGEMLVEIVNPENRFIVLNISRADRRYFPTGREVRIDFGTARPFLGKVRADVNPIPSAKNLDDNSVSIVIEPTGKPWPKLAIGTPVDVTPKAQ